MKLIIFLALCWVGMADNGMAVERRTITVTSGNVWPLTNAVWWTNRIAMNIDPTPVRLITNEADMPPVFLRARKEEQRLIDELRKSGKEITMKRLSDIIAEAFRIANEVHKTPGFTYEPGLIESVDYRGTTSEFQFAFLPGTKQKIIWQKKEHAWRIETTNPDGSPGTTWNLPVEQLEQKRGSVWYLVIALILAFGSGVFGTLIWNKTL